jgi:hypothetical protein
MRSMELFASEVMPHFSAAPDARRRLELRAV